MKVYKGKTPQVFVKISRKTKTIKCKCGGQVMVDGKMRHRVPLGFGFAPGDPRFRFDFAEYEGWYGECLKCGKTVFAYYSKRHTVKHMDVKEMEKRGKASKKRK